MMFWDAESEREIKQGNIHSSQTGEFDEVHDSQHGEMVSSKQNQRDNLTEITIISFTAIHPLAGKELAASCKCV